MKYYTLYYQPKTAIDRVIAVATSDSLLKLCKIKYATFRNIKGFPYIIRTEDFGDKDAFQYGAGCLVEYERAEFDVFVDKVDKNKQYNTYDYSQRVRKLLNRSI